MPLVGIVLAAFQSGPGRAGSTPADHRGITSAFVAGLTLPTELVVIAPVVVVYLLFQRSFVNGITQGPIKG